MCSLEGFFRPGNLGNLAPMKPPQVLLGWTCLQLGRAKRLAEVLGVGPVRWSCLYRKHHQKSEGIIGFWGKQKCIALKIVDIMGSKKLMVWRSQNHQTKKRVKPLHLIGGSNRWFLGRINDSRNLTIIWHKLIWKYETFHNWRKTWFLWVGIFHYLRSHHPISLPGSILSPPWGPYNSKPSWKDVLNFGGVSLAVVKNPWTVVKTKSQQLWRSFRKFRPSPRVKVIFVGENVPIRKSKKIHKKCQCFFVQSVKQFFLLIFLVLFDFAVKPP